MRTSTGNALRRMLSTFVLVLQSSGWIAVYERGHERAHAGVHRDGRSGRYRLKVDDRGRWERRMRRSQPL